MGRAELIHLLTEGRQELDSLLGKVPADQMEKPVLTNGWSIKDLYGHLGFWEERALALYHWFAGGAEPSPRPGTVTTDEINASAAASFRGRSLADLVQSERAAYQAMLELAQTAPEPDLFDPLRFTLTDGHAFVDWIEGNTYGHYQEHLPDLRGWLDEPGMVAYALDGQTVRAYVAHPAAGGPGVVLLHAWWGLNDFFKRQCDRLAGAGFTVIAPDLYNGKVVQTIPEAEQALQGMDSKYAEQAVHSAAAQLKKMKGVSADRFGAIGFSMGAAWSLALSINRPEEIAAVVLYYGSYSIDFQRSRAAYLGHFAEKDDWEPLQEVRATESALKKAGREVTFYFYPGTGHWFSEDDRPDAYRPQAAELAWTRTLEFLNAQLKKPA